MPGKSTRTAPFCLGRGKLVNLAWITDNLCREHGWRQLRQRLEKMGRRPIRFGRSLYVFSDDILDAFGEMRQQQADDGEQTTVERIQ